MFQDKTDSILNYNNIPNQNNNDLIDNNKISTNRLINESISLNSKVEQYRQALSMNSASYNNYRIFIPTSI